MVIIRHALSYVSLSLFLLLSPVSVRSDYKVYRFDDRYGVPESLNDNGEVLLTRRGEEGQEITILFTPEKGYFSYPLASVAEGDELASTKISNSQGEVLSYGAVPDGWFVKVESPHKETANFRFPFDSAPSDSMNEGVMRWDRPSVAFNNSGAFVFIPGSELHVFDGSSLNSLTLPEGFKSEKVYINDRGEVFGAGFNDDVPGILTFSYTKETGVVFPSEFHPADFAENAQSIGGFTSSRNVAAATNSKKVVVAGPENAPRALHRRDKDLLSIGFLTEDSQIGGSLSKGAGTFSRAVTQNRAGGSAGT